MANQTGIAITIKAFLPTGKTIDEQFRALSIVKEAHELGTYSTLLNAAIVEEVKTEQKTRRIEDAPPATNDHVAEGAEKFPEPEAKTEPETEAKPDPKPEPATDADVPEFLKKEKKAKAA
jgi:hypothetical protein